MDLLNPFSFPSSAPGRRHGPAGYGNYQEYKDWLRDEFVFRCVYCLERETWYPSRKAAFSVEHIIPQAQRPDLICEYENLAYACLRCNCLKQQIETLDPTRVGLGAHICFQPDGSVVGPTDEGREFILLFHLNVAPATKVRNEMMAILRLKGRYPDDVEVNKLVREKFGYPVELPDLRSPAKR